MNALKGLMRLLSIFSATAFLAFAPAAQADVVTFSGASGFAGSTVALRFSGDINMFSSGDLEVAFDGTFLTYVGTNPGDVMSAANIIVTPGDPIRTAVITLVAADPGADLGVGPFDYFDLLFMIAPGATGNTTVTLGGSSSLYFGLDAEDLRVVAGFNAIVNVLDLLAVPIGSTAPLVLSALAALALTRRRSLRSHPAHPPTAASMVAG